MVGVYTVSVANSGKSSEVIQQIDSLFATASTRRIPRRRNRSASSSSGFGGHHRRARAVSGVILLIMALILGNTLAMGLRERTPELGAMRAIGFLPRHVRAISITEGGLLGVLGGLLGVAFAQPVLTSFGKLLSSLGFLTASASNPGPPR